MKRIAPLYLWAGAAFTSPAFALDENFVLTADKVEYSRDGKIITASGQVEVVSAQGAVQADNLTYDIASDKLTANGNVLILDETQTSLFADSINITGDFKNGAIETLRMRAGPTGGPALTARRAIKRANIYDLQQARYSACPIAEGDTDDDLPWRINADNIEYNADEEEITYRGASLSAWGTPILYLPWLKHTTNIRKGESGFTPPRFGRSSRTGEEATIGYYYRPEENQDYLFKLRGMTEKGLLATMDARYIGTNLASEFNVSLADDKDLEKFRHSLEGSAEFTVKPGVRYGVNTQLASDDTYLDEYFNKTQAYLPTTAYIEHTSPQHYTAMYASYFDDLREFTDDSNTAQVLPRFLFERVFDEDKLGGEVVVTGDATILDRDIGPKYRRMIGGVEWRKPLRFMDGSLVDVSAKVRGDLYHIDDSLNNNDGYQTRGYSALTLNWEKPYLSPSGRQVVSPQVMLVLSPDSGGNRLIPNEDSDSLELNSTNLFETNRFSGLDQVEAGSRVVYGLNSMLSQGEDTFYQLFFGQSYRLTENNSLPGASGLEDKNSDWVGAWTVQPNRFINFSQRFRLDNNSFATRQIDTEFNLTDGSSDGNYATGTHTYLKDGPQEFNMEGRYNLTDRVFLETEMRRDLGDSSRWLNFELGLGYRHDCYNVVFSGRRRGYVNREVESSTDFMLNFELLTLGRDHD